MTKKAKTFRPKARLPKGFRDIGGPEVRSMEQMITRIRQVYDIYGFDPLDTPAFEFTDALGKFLPDQDRPNAGVFSLEDEDGQWMSLRYDLTAPLARFVAQNYDGLPKPFRRYQTGSVFRNEKPGPGRYRQFTQFDADTVGAPVGAADAEMCMMMAEVMEAVGINRGQYIVRVNNRKFIDGVLESIGIGGDENSEKRLTVLRSLDKLDKFGVEGVRRLLGDGRKDESGDYTKGAGLDPDQITKLEALYGHQQNQSQDLSKLPPINDEASDDDDIISSDTDNDYIAAHPGVLDTYEKLFAGNDLVNEGLDELREISNLVRAAGFGTKRIKMDVSVIRGLEYYTGPVFEAEVTFDVTNDKGQVVQFGAVGGGGRYDGLVARFKGVEIPATGMSIGVSRLYTAMQMLDTSEKADQGPVLVLVMDRDRLTDYQAMAQELRSKGVRAELYLGTSGMRAQMKYADKRNAPCVIIQGEDELALHEVTIKDLMEGTRLSAEITDNKEWREGRPAQFSVPRSAMVESVAQLIKDQAQSVEIISDPGASA